MKKILLSCLVAAGIGVNAQYDFVGDFEDPAYYGQFGGGTITPAAACSGESGGQLAIAATTTQTGYMVYLDETGQLSNGQKVQVSAKYKKAAGVVGSFTLAYFIQDPNGTAWSVYPFGTAVSMTTAAITSCADLSGTIPAGALHPNAANAIGIWFTKTSGTGNVYVDDIVIKQEIANSAPNCTTITAPTAGAVLGAGTYKFTWNAVDYAVEYKLQIGTTSGASDVLDTTVNGTSYNQSLNPNKNYFVKVIPTNTVGDATGCQEVAFSTNSDITYCGPITTNQPGALAPIRSVSFAGKTNTSDPSPTGIGNFPVHQDFTSFEFPWYRDITSMPLNIQGSNNTNTTNGWGMSVFIDWNNDGNFEGPGESYFNTQATMIRVAGVATTVPVTGNITIPAGVSFGKKMMRIKYNFTGTTLHQALLTACGEIGNGQVEDYTIDYLDQLAVSDLSKSTISVYPNPFQDVVKISDIKGIKSITVSDITGRQVKNLAAAEEINLSDLNAGLYIINLNMVDGTNKAIKAIKK